MISPQKPASSTEVASHYDDLDWFYRDTWGEEFHHGLWEKGGRTTGEAISHLRKTIADAAGASRGAHVCDIGCGSGAAALRWSSCRGWRMTGFTVSRKQHEAAWESASLLEKSAPQPEFLLRDWLKNEMEDACFDAAVSIECLSHVSDKSAFFREIERTLKPGGRLSLSAWIAGRKISSRAQRLLLEPICEGGRFPSLLNAEELRFETASAGLVVENLDEVGSKVKKTWRVILWRLFVRLFTRSEYRKFLIGDARSGWLRTLTVLRVWIAFELGTLDYAIVSARKEELQ
ncbi:MAG: methyltransferase domain-containing protein [Verrucomicrobiota bacterium]